MGEAIKACCAEHAAYRSQVASMVDSIVSSLRETEAGLEALRVALRELQVACQAPPGRAESAAGQVVGMELSQQLTAREQSVLELLARGLTNKAIGAELRISERTVKNHVRSIFVKLRARSRTEAAYIALASGQSRQAGSTA
ncbi:helix-turn-helix transcriptional regulator [Streptomyces gobiensis]|uniref:helix-turn-helix transcriptional regulator n=1 Tax=Streptomyces gobiensis TaxID=2875706 RepID=UPI001E38A3AB|nr:response regulator transcription factor [Streptomyces gobiensis]UGY92581.1 response regulator transcription factor [Streptomyces gobiensis]